MYSALPVVLIGDANNNNKKTLQLQIKLSRIPIHGRLISCPFTQHKQGDEPGTTENKSMQWYCGRLEQGPPHLKPLGHTACTELISSFDAA